MRVPLHTPAWPGTPAARHDFRVATCRCAVDAAQPPPGDLKGRRLDAGS